MSKLIRVNIKTMSVTEEAVPASYNTLGGRGLTTEIICNEVPPTCHPLGEDNKIVIAPGILAGTAAPSSGRLAVGGKSPLTGGIKEANAGTPVSQMLGRLGIKAIIIEGMPEDPNYVWALHISKDGAKIIPADNLAGKGTYELVSELKNRYGEKAGFAGIGPAGEMKMAAAGVFFTDNEGRPSRYAARGGLGAVLGSKGFKALIVEPEGAPGVEILDKEAFKEGTKKLTNALTSHDLTKPGGVLNTYGTAATLGAMNAVGGLPTRNFSRGNFADAAKIGGEGIVEKVQQRGGAGKMGHGCVPGCVIKCSNIFPKEDGTEHVAKIEYETAGLLGANLEIGDIDVIAELTRLCNDFGVDTMEMGCALGVLMESGYIAFGDGPAAIKALEEVGKGTGIGRIIGNGASVVGQTFGVTRVPTVKRQGMAAYDPRGVKGIGITYGTNPMGADHTSGFTIASEVFGVSGKTDPLDTAGKIEMSRGLQVATAFLDCTGCCLFIAFAVLDIASGFEGLVQALNAQLGTNWDGNDPGRIGMEILQKEINFNKLAGFTVVDDRLPEFFKKEVLPPHNHVFDISDEALDTVWGAGK